MSKITLEIDGNEQSFREVWVHLQRVKEQNSAEYRILIPPEYARQVFDPYNTKASDISWREFIQGLVDELGTFIVQAFVKTIASIVGERETAYRWVIATVDETAETDKGIEMIGRVVPFIGTIVVESE